MLFERNRNKKAELWPSGRVLPLFFAAALLLGACRHKEHVPEGIMDTAEMASFLYDAYLLEGYYAITNNHSYDTVAPEALKAYDDLLRRHHVDRETVDSSMAYYAERPEVYARINDAALQRLEKENGPSEPEKPIGIEIKVK